MNRVAMIVFHANLDTRRDMRDTDISICGKRGVGVSLGHGQRHQSGMRGGGGCKSSRGSEI